jgi:translocation and assembly module TamA
MRTRLLFLSLVLLAASETATAAARLDFDGGGMTRRQAEGLMAPALRSPADSAALANGLEAVAVALQTDGYLDARARGEWHGRDLLMLRVTPGVRYHLGTISVHAATPDDSARTRSVLGLATGDVASPERIAQALEHAAAELVARGHAYAELSVGGWRPDSGQLHLSIAALPGPKVRVSQVRIEGLSVTREDVARRVLRGLEGEYYDPATAAQGRDRLLRLGLFRDVRFDGLVSAGDWSRGRLLYAVDEPRYNAFEGAVGAQGEGGIVGRARVELGNLLGTGRSTSLRWESTGQERSNIAAYYREPMVLGALLGADLMLEHEIRDSAYTRTRWGGGLHWTATARQVLEAGFDVERVVQTAGTVSESHLENVRFAVERAVWDDVAAPRRGYRTRVAAAQVFKRERLRPTGSATSRASAVQGWIDLKRPLGPRTGASLELSGAGRFSSEPVLSTYERWSLGGAATLRGFDEDQFRIDRYGLSRFEWRLDAGSARQHAYLFWDHAWTWTRQPVAGGGDEVETRHLDGIGGGLRLETRAGRVGLAYGLEVGRPPLEGKIHVQLVSAF